MKERSNVVDGASLRNSRIRAMLQFIASVEGGATMRDIQSFMLLHYGMKFSTTQEYVYECNLAGALTLTENNRWIVSDGYKKYLK